MFRFFSLATESRALQTTQFSSAVLGSFEHLSGSSGGCFYRRALIDHSKWFLDRSAICKPFVLRASSGCFFSYNYGILKVAIY